jgi:microcystin-dependent protein
MTIIFLTIKLHLMDSYIGTIMLFAGNFAPRGWALCQGQLLPIAQNSALFSILGTAFGGNGQTNFALPDLRGRVPVGTGQGPGLSNNWQQGMTDGTETVTLVANEMPMHNHNVMVSAGDADSPTAGGNYLAKANANLSGDEVTVNTYNGSPSVALGGNSVSVSGGNQPHPNIQPSLGINYIICLEGIFPSRN